MKLFSKYILSLATVTVLCAPFSVFAHASPISYVPDSSAVVDSIPSVVEIRFSERLDEGASMITVTGPSGKKVSSGKASVGDDPHTLSVPISDDGAGTYFVSWGVVSSDDGHFTKGAYPFGVGAETTVTATQQNTEVIQITSVSEGAAMTLELFGNGLMWALLLIFALMMRPLLMTGRFEAESRTLSKGYAFIVCSAVLLIWIGGLSQIAIKAESLATLHGIGFVDALVMYVQTVAGSATVFRLLAALGVFVVFLFGKKSIVSSRKITIYEIGMLVLMGVFAFFRAKVSHATANPFMPDLSIAVNFFHLIEKDIWAGALTVLLFVFLVKSLRGFFEELLPRVFNFLAINFLFLSVTATYIVWLHLKSFANLFTTQWGGAFLNLLIAAIVLVVLRVYHVLSRVFARPTFRSLLPVTLGAELAVAVLLIFYSSIVIVTSPPLSGGAHILGTASDQGVSVSLERPASDDSLLLLTAEGLGKPKAPIVWVSGAQGTEGQVLVETPERFKNGYAFPSAFLAGDGPFTVSAVFAQEKGYDARIEFTVSKNDLTLESEHAKRTFDSFTLSMLSVAVSALLFALAIVWISRMKSADGNEYPRASVSRIIALASFIVAFLLVFYTIQAFASSSLPNSFKYRCTEDGNMWHMMLPTKAGVPTSAIPQEGCMWGMGQYQYLFTDSREYEYVRGFGEANVSLAINPETPVAGVPTMMTASLKNSVGTPAKLFVDMEKLVHMVIVSKDQSVFAHIHPDDIRPLTPEEIRASTFTFRYAFPKAGEYLLAVDYANGIVLGSKRFTVSVGGAPQQEGRQTEYQSPVQKNGYEISLKTETPFSGMVSVMRFHITKDGKPVTELEPYLSAAAHVAVVKNDLSAFLHTHGEYHPPGVPYPPVIVKNGKIIHSIAAMKTPSRFGPDVDAHVIFPSSGLYTIWAQFKVGGEVIAAPFTVRID